MKLFYHFLFFVFASLILVACASMFGTDPKSRSQIEEFPAFDGKNNIPVTDSMMADNLDRPFAFTSLKVNSPAIKIVAKH